MRIQGATTILNRYITYALSENIKEPMHDIIIISLVLPKIK